MRIIVRLGNSFGPRILQNQNVQNFVIRFNLYNLDFFSGFLKSVLTISQYDSLDQCMLAAEIKFTSRREYTLILFAPFKQI